MDFDFVLTKVLTLVSTKIPTSYKHIQTLYIIISIVAMLPSKTAVFFGSIAPCVISDFTSVVGKFAEFYHQINPANILMFLWLTPVQKIKASNPPYITEFCPTMKMGAFFFVFFCVVFFFQSGALFPLLFATV